MHGEKGRQGEVTWMRYHRKTVLSLQEKAVGTTASAESAHKEALLCLHVPLILRGQCASLGPRHKLMYLKT